MSGPRLAPVRRCADDGGAVFIEFALILPVLVFLVIAIFEGGVAFRNKTVISAALRSSARVAAHGGNTPAIDYEAILAVQAGLAQTKGVTLTKVIIYQVTIGNLIFGNVGPGGITGCLTAAPASAPAGCNVYGPNRLNTLAISSDTAGRNFFWKPPAVCINANTAGIPWDKKWCPTIRKVDMTVLGPDFVGVYAEADYTPISRLLPSTMRITDKAIAQIEPVL